MSRRCITATDLYQLNWVSDPQISPDGQFIAYVVKHIDTDTMKYQTAIWLAPVTQGIGAGIRFTADGHTPRWSPDGQKIAFVTDRAGPLPAPKEDESTASRDKRYGKGKSQIWLMPTQGGEAYQLTFLRDGASSPVWSPDSSQILFSGTVSSEPDIPEHDGKPEPRAHRITRVMYRWDSRGFFDEKRTHLLTISANGGDPQQLTDGDWDEEHATWSPDGQKIAFVTDRREERWTLPRWQIWMMNADGSDQHSLTDPASEYDFMFPSWSPDGTQLACAAEAATRGGGHADIFVFAPGAEPRCLTQEQFVSFSDAIGNDQRSDHASAMPYWTPDGKSLLVLGNARGAGNIYQLAVEDGTLTPVTSGDHHLLGFSVDQQTNAIATVIADARQPGDLFIHWRDSQTTYRLTDSNAALLEEVEIATPERFDFVSTDGWAIEGWILYPPNFNPDQKYPLLLEIHGGPNTCYGYSFVLEFQLLAAQGYVVVYTNPRGSTSYGRDFGKAVHGRWGLEDYLDLMAGVDAVVDRGFIDTKRMGVLGGSYGGFMTNWILGHTDRFAAAITQRSICNLVSKFGTSDIGPWMARDNWDVPYWENMEKYHFHSPLTYVKNVVTPLLIIHSVEDWRCPIEQAEQFFTALKVLGREVEFLRFEGQSHELTRSGHPRLRVVDLEAKVEWFNRYLSASKSTEYVPAETVSVEAE
jgi:dipeptidyl aminopeptidase/acylaminoacyl peptidase